MNAWRNLRVTVAALVAAGLASGCVVVVDGERGQDEEWGVSWGGSSQEVDPASPRDELAREVSARLASEPGLSGQDITVSSREGVVTLHGRVESVTTLEEAMNVAAEVPGVSRVVSRLTVVREGS